MDNPKPPPDRVLLDDNVRKTVERTALRKIRNVLDALEGDDQNDRRFRVGVYAACGFLVLLVILIVVMLVRR
ncbi:MAG TPA: hypothetical protein VES94_06030 [Burkholderiales bacterium]|nr:hypothetical protein [Burkholderiales bacterium]